jgi:gamma-glutamylcyclotransferase (GGCT)/AIG2-like uncharacterized protein YtfP
MTISLFAYGTLEIPQVLEAVTGRTFPAQQALLPNYARFLLHGQIYPGCYRDHRSQVAGILYDGVDADSIALLDLFEGDFYRRERVRVTTSSQQSPEAACFVVRPEHRLLITRTPWNREAFIARHLADFLPYCSEFHSNQARRLGLEPGPR